MTFEEAKSLKNAVPNPYMHEGKEHTPLIVPLLQNDYINYLSDLRKNSITEEEMKKYSTNGEFTVMGFLVGIYPDL